MRPDGVDATQQAGVSVGTLKRGRGLSAMLPDRDGQWTPSRATSRVVQTTSRCSIDATRTPGLGRTRPTALRGRTARRRLAAAWEHQDSVLRRAGAASHEMWCCSAAYSTGTAPRVS